MNLLDVALRDLARGNTRYGNARETIAAEIIRHSRLRLGPLTPFLAERLFRISSRSALALDLADSDWRLLRSLLSAGAAAGLNYLQLAVHYIAANLPAVAQMTQFDADISRSILEDYIDSEEDVLESRTRLAGQSLYALRYVAAKYSVSTDTIMERLATRPTSRWVRNRFLYPLVFMTVNAVHDEWLKTAIAFTSPPDVDSQTEARAIQFLLREELGQDEPLAFKLYLGLMAHPYDLLQIIITHFECEFGKSGHIGADYTALLADIHDLTGDSRLGHLLRLARSELGRYQGRISGLRIAEMLCLSEKSERAYAQILDTVQISEPPIDNEIVKRLRRLRDPRYPNPREWIHASSIGYRYMFTTAGRFIYALLCSQYMFPRSARDSEIRQLIRLHFFIGYASPTVYASPSGKDLLERNLVRLYPGFGHTFELITVDLGAPAPREDRTWIKAIHWHLAPLEQKLRFGEWSRQILAHIDVAPKYVTGIDWAWVEDVVIKSVKIRPFAGSPAGIYLFLLEMMDRADRDANRVRVAADPIIAEANGNVWKFYEWIKDNLPKACVAMCRYVLTPDILLWFEFSEGNYTQALRDHYALLERCVEDFGYTAILTKEDLRSEQRVFSTALMLISVGANQFQISWPTIKRDSFEANREAFNTYLAFANAPVANDILSAARKELIYDFANNVVVRFDLPNHDWPLGIIILGIINSFVSHPAHGIEAILSIRIRHNNLRREFVSLLQRLQHGSYPGISIRDRDIVPKFMNHLTEILRKWVDRYMHHVQASRPEGVFNFIPNNDELVILVTGIRNARHYEEIADYVIGWLKGRLVEQLALARARLSTLRAALIEGVEARGGQLQASGELDPSVAGPFVGTLKSALVQEFSEIVEWFQEPTPLDESVVSAQDIRLAVEGRFVAEIRDGRLKLAASEERLSSLVLSADHVRLLFDLLCEGVENAMTHGSGRCAHMRLRVFRRKGVAGITISSRGAASAQWQRTFVGHPQKAGDGAVYREGKSGLGKIAALAASIAQRELEVTATQKRSTFHIEAPLQFEGDS